MTKLANIQHPFGGAQVETPDFSASLEVEIDNDGKTHIVIDDVNGNLELTLTANADLEPGSQVLVLLTDISGSSDTLTLAGDATGTLADLGASETDLIELEYIDGGFKVVGQQTQ